jgi:NAD(P)-dependent dehydrogenase (short-subunit alcohol dehydrogenase family)
VKEFQSFCSLFFALCSLLGSRSGHAFMADTSQHPIAIVCGSAMPIGAALVTRLLAAGTPVAAVDFAAVADQAGARLRLHGDLGSEPAWHTMATTIREQGLTPTSLVFALHTSDAPLPLFELPQARWDAVYGHNLRSAYLACKYLLPLMARGGAVVLLASIYAGWDVRAEAAAQSASEAGLLALARSLALSGGPSGVRVNAVCYGLLAYAEQVARDARLQQAVGRIPLGRATSPDDVVDTVEFLLSPDARHITGSTLVVDGGQSLQSWSNAPE